MFLTKWVGKWVRKTKLAESELVKAIDSIDCGSGSIDLGGGIHKVRIPRPGQGKSGGFRTIIAFHSGHRAAILFAFAKSDIPNIGQDDLVALRKSGQAILEMSDEEVQVALSRGFVVEIGDKK